MSWEGTDENNHYMVSAANRLENFERWGIVEMYKSMLAYDSKVTASVPAMGQAASECVKNFKDNAKKCIQLVAKPKEDDYETWKKFPTPF